MNLSCAWRPLGETGSGNHRAELKQLANEFKCRKVFDVLFSEGGGVIVSLALAMFDVWGISRKPEVQN